MKNALKIAKRHKIVVIMAKSTSLVLLGYDDEQITDKQISFVDYTTNKIGGKPVSSIVYLCFHFWPL